MNAAPAAEAAPGLAPTLQPLTQLMLEIVKWSGATITGSFPDAVGVVQFGLQAFTLTNPTSGYEKLNVA
jgi:hypothetical protein